jgi:hypothetical protein
MGRTNFVPTPPVVTYVRNCVINYSKYPLIHILPHIVCVFLAYDVMTQPPAERDCFFCNFLTQQYDMAHIMTRAVAIRPIYLRHRFELTRRPVHLGIERWFEPGGGNSVTMSRETFSCVCVHTLRSCC